MMSAYRYCTSLLFRHGARSIGNLLKSVRLAYSGGTVPVMSLTRKSIFCSLMRFEYSAGNVPSRLAKLTVKDVSSVMSPNSVGNVPSVFGATLISNSFMLFNNPISVGSVPSSRGTSPIENVSFRN